MDGEQLCLRSGSGQEQAWVGFKASGRVSGGRVTETGQQRLQPESCGRARRYAWTGNIETFEFGKEISIDIHTQGDAR